VSSTADRLGNLIGELIDDRYRIRRLIGSGGMGAVYEAEAIRLGRLCAVKALLPEYTCDENAVQRFRREAQVAARLKHSNVVEIFDTGTTSGGLGYIAMELLHGESLDTTLYREKRIPWRRARHYVLQVCRALAVAHDQNIVHRDMKPDNCFRITREGDTDFIKVLDFGIAKLTEPDEERASRLTMTNSVLGTDAYMAYEQVAGEECDHRVDIWAVGVILHELLTGTVPFTGKNQGQIWAAIFQHEPRPMREIAPDANIPGALEAIVARALRKPRDERYPTIKAFAHDLIRVEDHAAAAERPRPAKFAGSERQLASIAREMSPPVAVPVAPEATASAPTSTPITDPAIRVAPAERPDTIVQGRRPLSQRGRARWLIPLGAATVALVTLMLVLRGGEPPRQPGSEPIAIAAPVSPTPGAAPVLPDPGPDPASLPAAGTPPSSPTAAPPIGEPPVAAPPQPDDEPPILFDDPPAPVTPPPPSAPKRSVPVKKPEAARVSFAVKIPPELERLRSSGAMRACFTTNDAEGKRLPVDMTINASTGKAERVVLPAMLSGSALARCVEREIRSFRFSTGLPGEADYVTRQYNLNK
jgi:serine/threonine-protein kinase